MTEINGVHYKSYAVTIKMDSGEKYVSKMLARDEDQVRQILNEHNAIHRKDRSILKIEEIKHEEMDD